MLNISAIEYKRWKTSIISTINFDYLGFSYEDMLRLFHEGNTADTRYKEMLNKGHDVYLRYRAMKETLAALNWEAELFADTLRGTIHHKNNPSLGVRVYPEYKKSSMMLPYHGIAIVDVKADHYVLTIEPEVYQHEKDVVAVNKLCGLTDFYLTKRCLNAITN